MVIGYTFTALIIAGLTLLLIWMVKRFGSSSLENPNKSSAIEILNLRYGKGEIHKGEYNVLKKDIN